MVFALEYALRVKNLEQMHASYDGKDKIPIVETYINICNAYTFQNIHEAALDYAEGGITVS